MGNSMRSILFLDWKSIGNIFAKQAFENKGLAVEMFPFDYDNEDTRSSAKLAEELVEKIMSQSYEFVFSFNYFPVVAMACKACRIKYVSWTYDSPFIQIYSKTVTLETNYVFIFDRAVCEDLWSRGVNTVYYLPMAAAVSYYDTMIPSEALRKKLDADVTMVGSMYTEPKHDLNRHLAKLDTYTKGYLDAVIHAQKLVYGYNFLEQCLSEEVMKAVQKVCPVRATAEGMETAEWTFANYFLARRVTALERMDIMKLLQDDFKVQLFTHEQTPELAKVQNMGRADYYNHAPYVFKSGKIHLNITLRSILTGIPQRAFDIMGCGGFLLSNFQSDFLEHFVPDEDFVIYENYEDLFDKVKYYTEHEAERKRIAMNGYEKVKEYHTYDKRVEQILEIIE